MQDDSYDVVVIGGGPAGLGAALALGRARRSVLVVGGREPRNAPASEMHSDLGRDGTAPQDLLTAGRGEVARTTERWSPARSWPRGRNGRLRDRCGRRSDGPGTSAAITTGLVDDLPDVPGVRDLWGGDVNYFLHTAPEPSDEEWEQLATRGIGAVAGEVAALETADGRLHAVRLVTGETFDRSAMVVAPRFTTRSGVLGSLELHPAKQELNGHIYGSAVPADPSGATAVPGVWVAGTVTDRRAQVITSAAAGLHAAVAINTEPIGEDTRRAVEAHQAGPFSAAAERELCKQVLGDRRHGI